MNSKRFLITASIVGVICLCACVFGIVVPFFLSSENVVLIFLGITLMLLLVFGVVVFFAEKLMEYFNE